MKSTVTIDTPYGLPSGPVTLAEIAGRTAAAFTLPVIDERLLDRPTESMRTMLLELTERRYGETSTVFCTQYSQKDWHQRLGSGVHTDAIMDRIIHNTIWVETGNYNMREHTALATA
ncbi:DNA replication protein DnaC [Arthrobacter sp. UYCu712]